MSHTPTPGPEYVGYIHEPTFYSIGDRFPFENPRPGTEGGGLITHTGFMGVAFWTSDPQKDQPTFENELVMCALWERGFLQFLILHIPDSGLTCDLFFNPLLMNPEGRQLWAEADTQFIMLYLIDERTNVLLAWRALRVPPAMARRIQGMARFYWDNDEPGRADELTRRAELQMNTYTGQQMLAELGREELQYYCAFSQPVGIITDTINSTDEKEQQ